MNQIWYATNGCSYFRSCNTGGSESFVFRNTAQSDIFTIRDNGNITSTGSFTNNQFSASTNNQIVLKNINVYPAVVGSGGYFVIDVQDYAVQGYCYLQLCVSSTNFFWMGRVF